jgi:UrcA family protein
MLTPSNSLTEEHSMNIFNSIRTRRIPRPLVLSALAFSFTGFAGIGAAQAAPDDGGVLKTAVRYAREDLATDSGARALFHRLTMAADGVCPQIEGIKPFVSSQVMRCRDNAVRQAVLQINHPRLTRVLADMTPVERFRGQAGALEHDSRRIKPVNSGG